MRHGRGLGVGKSLNGVGKWGTILSTAATIIASAVAAGEALVAGASLAAAGVAAVTAGLTFVPFVVGGLVVWGVGKLLTGRHDEFFEKNPGSRTFLDLFLGRKK